MKRPWIVKAGGELLNTEKTRKKILADLVRWHKTKSLVFVHGGGPQIEAELAKNKIPIEFREGRRITSNAGMVIVEQVLSGLVNKSLAAELNRKGAPAVGLSCRDGKIIQGHAHPKLGRAGKPVKVNPKLIYALLEKGFLPILSSVSSDEQGNALNINADDAASALACSIKAENLVFLTDTTGVHDKSKKRIPVLKTTEISKLIVQKVIKGGMIPKVQSAVKAVMKGVEQVNITNGYHGINFNFGTKIIK